jgi:branched-chain amino acid transport system ATP-binding protein
MTGRSPAPAGLPAPEPALEVESLDAWYGGARILTGVTFHVAAGEVVALLGRNGAGKTTTLRTVFGLGPRRRGRLRFFGRDLTACPPHRIAHRGLGYVPEDRRLFADLTVAENLEMGRLPPRPDRPPWTPARLFALFPNLGARATGLAGRLSGGEQQMLALARALMGNPLVLMLDEPSEGLAPRLVQTVAQILRELRSQGVGVLLAEQSLSLAEAVADRAYIIEKGEIRHHAPMATLSADPAARRTWLAV